MYILLYSIYIFVSFVICWLFMYSYVIYTHTYIYIEVSLTAWGFRHQTTARQGDLHNRCWQLPWTGKRPRKSCCWSTPKSSVADALLSIILTFCGWEPTTWSFMVGFALEWDHHHWSCKLLRRNNITFRVFAVFRRRGVNIWLRHASSSKWSFDSSHSLMSMRHLDAILGLKDMSEAATWRSVSGVLGTSNDCWRSGSFSKKAVSQWWTSHESKHIKIIRSKSIWDDPQREQSQESNYLFHTKKIDDGSSLAHRRNFWCIQKCLQSVLSGCGEDGSLSGSWMHLVAVKLRARAWKTGFITGAISKLGTLGCRTNAFSSWNGNWDDWIWNTNSMIYHNIQWIFHNFSMEIPSRSQRNPARHGFQVQTLIAFFCARSLLRRNLFSTCLFDGWNMVNRRLPIY